MEKNENMGINEKKELVIDYQAQSYLKISATWAKVIAVISFIMIAFIILAGIGMLMTGSLFTKDLSTINTEIEGGITGGLKSYFMYFMSVLYIVLGLIMLYPAIKLYQFAENTSTAIRRTDSDVLKAALENHKSYFKFTGIMLLAIIGLYIIGIIAFVILAIFKFT